MNKREVVPVGVNVKEATVFLGECPAEVRDLVQGLLPEGAYCKVTVHRGTWDDLDSFTLDDRIEPRRGSR